MPALPGTHRTPTLELRHQRRGEPEPTRHDARFALRICLANVSDEPNLVRACSVSVNRANGLRHQLLQNDQLLGVD